MSETENFLEEVGSATVVATTGNVNLVETDEILEATTEQLCSICLDLLPDASKEMIRSTRQAQLLAVVEPCKHQYHDFCIKSWSERANTCPTCRCKFNSIVLKLGNQVFDKVSIKDKTFPIPEPEDFDDLIIDDYAYDDYTDPDYIPGRANSLLVPYSICILCDEMSSSRTGLVICNSCSGSFHPNCLGRVSNLGMWNCPMCDSAQSSESVIPPTSTRGRGLGPATVTGSSRAVNSFISSLRDEIRTNRRSALGLPLESISRRRRHLRSSNNNNTQSGMFGPPPTLSPPPVAPVISKEEADAWKLYDKAKKTELNKSTPSTRLPTPTVVSSQRKSEKKVKKPIRKKHKDPISTKDDTGISQTDKQKPIKMTTVNAILSSMTRNSSQKTQPQIERSLVTEVQSSNNLSPSSLSFSSHESSPTSVSLSSDEENLADKKSQDMQTIPTKLTLAALLKHDSKYDRVASSPHKEGNGMLKSELTLSQKQFLQKVIVRTKLKPLYNDNKIDTDEYTIINKSVSRKLYKLVSDNELQGDQRFIILLNKLIELRERFEYESYDSFIKRISSDVYTTLDDRGKIDRYSILANDYINEEITVMRLKGR